MNLKKNNVKGHSNEMFPRKDSDSGDLIESKISQYTIFKVASATVINRGDNIGVYVSLYTRRIIQMILTDFIFIVMIGVLVFYQLFNG